MFTYHLLILRDISFYVTMLIHIIIYSVYFLTRSLIVMNKKIFDKIRNENPFLPLSDIVHELLLQNIISFSLEPGTRISENSISQELGISRSPIKTALEGLSERGFIRIRNSRYYVADFDEAEYRDIFDLTVMIEPFAAAKAARKISDEQLSELYRIAHRLTELYAEAYESGRNFGYSKLLDQEIAFHSGLVRASGNSLIANLYDSKKYVIWRYRGYLLYSRPEGFFKTLDTDHTLICDILKLHDDELAAAVTRRHLHVSRDGIERYELISKPRKIE